MLEGRFATRTGRLARAEQAGLHGTSRDVRADARQRTLSRRAAVPRSGIAQEVQPFRSSDGSLLLRGRDAKGNAQLLELAACRTISGCIPAVGRARTS